MGRRPAWGCVCWRTATGSALAQNGTMMDGGMWGPGWMGGYGGYWVPVLVVAVLVGLIVWVVKQKK
jgi:hypothetical protein